MNINASRGTRSLILCSVLAGTLPGLSGCGGGGASDAATSPQSGGAGGTPQGGVFAPEPNGLDTDTVIARTVSRIVEATNAFGDSIATLSGNDAGAVVTASTGLDGGAGDAAIGGVPETSGAIAELLEIVRNDPETVITREGDRITIDPSERNLCDALARRAEPGPFDRFACESLLALLSIEIEIHSAQSGTLRALYDGHLLVAIDHAPDVVDYRVDLAGVKDSLVSAAAVVQPGQDPGLPETVEGRLRLRVERLGTAHARLVLAIDTSVEVSGVADGQIVSLRLDATPKLFASEVDGAAHAATFEIGMQAIRAAFPVRDRFGNVFPAGFRMAGMTLQAAVAEGNVTVTNLGIGDAPMTVTIDGRTAVELTLASFGFVASAVDNTLALTGDFDLDLRTSDELGLVGATGKLAIDAPRATVFQPVGGGENPVVRVLSGGPLSVTGTGDLFAFLNAPAGTCFEPGSFRSVSCQPAGPVKR